MEFKMSSAVAVQAADVAAAQTFYTEVLGFDSADQGGVLAIDASPLTMFVDENTHGNGILMELIVDDLDAARAHLEAHGARVVVWGGLGKSNIIEDPFGVRFNIWQQR